MTYQTALDHIKFITGQDNLSDTDGIRIINFALDSYSSIATESHGWWKFADTSRTTQEKSYTAAVSGQHDYSLDTSFLKIDGVQVKVDGKWRGLTQVDRREYRDVPLDERYSTPGTPVAYDFDGSSFYLYPALNWSDAGDLTDIANLTIRVLHTRFAAHITSLSSTIGIPDGHLEYLALHGARQLGFRTADSKKTDIRDELVKWEGTEINGRRSGGKIRAFYSGRDEDRPRRLKPNNTTNHAFNKRSNI